jgi:hypothetical protein
LVVPEVAQQRRGLQLETDLDQRSAGMKGEETVLRIQKTEDRKQKTEDRRQESEVIWLAPLLF